MSPAGAPMVGTAGEAKVGVDSLAGLSHKKQWRADHGKSGGPHNRQGRSAKDVILFVPPGTIVVDQSTGLQIKDLAHPGEKIVVAKGGAGGRGNVHFKSSVNRAPRESTTGEVGVSRLVILIRSNSKVHVIIPQTERSEDGVLTSFRGN